MSPETIFSIANSIALFTWVFLFIAPKWRWAPSIFLGGVITLLALIYSFLVFSALKPDDFQSFSTLEGVVNLFKDPNAVLAGWIHYLAFDLMVGWFIISDAQKNGIKHLWTLPCLLFTFMLGPFGLLLYFVLRLVLLRNYFNPKTA